MDLPEGGEGKIGDMELLKEDLAVSLDAWSLVPAGEPEVQALSRRATHTSVPRAEGMHNPGQPPEGCTLQPGKSATCHAIERLDPQPLNITHRLHLPVGAFVEIWLMIW